MSHPAESAPPAEKLVEDVRDSILNIRHEVGSLITERLDTLRHVRQQVQSNIDALRLEHQFVDEDEPERDPLLDSPTVNQDSIMGVAWQQPAAQVPFEKTLRLADEMLDDKDAEIQRLRDQLEQLQEQDNQVADSDLVSENDQVDIERKKLQSLQDEWREKMRRAEVEFSLERAKLTREHEQLTEKLCRLEAELERSSGGRQGGGRKWLKQLGLSDSRD